MNRDILDAKNWGDKEDRIEPHSTTWEDWFMLAVVGVVLVGVALLAIYNLAMFLPWL